MSKTHSETRVHLRVVERIGSGRMTRFPDVFCPFRRTSQSLELCRACPHYDRVDAGAIVCKREPPLSTSAAAALFAERRICSGEGSLAYRVLLGERSSAHTLCISSDTPAGEGAARVVATGAIGGIVVDGGLRPVGFLSHASLAGLPPEALPRPVIECSTDPFLVMAEDTSLADAITRMVEEHQRIVVTTDGEGRTTGSLSDVDVLRWLGAVSRGRRTRG